MDLHYSLHPLGDNAVMIQLGEAISLDISDNIQRITSFLDQHPQEWMIEYIPSYTCIAIFYDLVKIPFSLNSDVLPYDFICQKVQQLLADVNLTITIKQRIIELPVCYGGDFGPDLAFVAEHNGLTSDEVIHIHTTGHYFVHMIGFAPGFPYIGGMSEKIAVPRKHVPRLKIPSRSVGIGGKQTGVYPIETPGGWQIIGRTPLHLFRPNSATPTLLKAGDQVIFKPISLKEYFELEESIDDKNH